MRPLLISLLLAALLSTLPFHQRPAEAAQSSIAAVENYASGLDRYIKRNASAARYFADTAAYEQENAPARWQEFRTKRALDAAWENGKTYTSSNVWFSRSGAPVVALFTFSSPSGDWVQYLTNYYREDGTLAKSSAELRTFMGDIIRIKDQFYDGKGKVIKEQTRYLDLKTRRPKRVNKEQFMDMDIPLYQTTSALPFNSLLKKR